MKLANIAASIISETQTGRNCRPYLLWSGRASISRKISNKRNPKSNRTLICQDRSFWLYSQLPCQRASEGNMGDSGDSSFFHKLRLRVHQRLSRSMRAGPIDRQKKLLLAGAGIIALLSESASAADLARPAPVYTPPPPVVAVFTWTGCYVGGNIGGLWANDTWSDTVFGGFGGSTASGVLGGAQIGCNYQVGAWVFGIQADYDWTNANSNTANAIIPALIGGPVVGLSDSTQHNALASVTARVGYSWDRWLAYVKAGGSTAATLSRLTELTSPPTARRKVVGRSGLAPNMPF